MSFKAIPIMEFLKRRAHSVMEAREAQKYNEDMIIVDPGDDIICDLCNSDVTPDDARIEDLQVNLEGVVWIKNNMLYCSDCRRK